MSSEINNTVNGSIINIDLLSDELDDVKAFKKALSAIPNYFFPIADVFRFLLGVLAVTIDIYLIVIISKFKNLRNRTNSFILQYAIFHLLYMLLASVIQLLLAIFTVRHNNYCFITNLDHLTLTLSFYALLFMAIDWYVSNCHSNIYGRYPKTFKHGAYILYLFAIPKWIASSTICFVEDWRWSDIRIYLELASFIFCAIIVIAITILKRKKVLCAEAYKTEYALTIPRIVLFWTFFMFAIRLIVICVENIVADTYKEIFYIIYYIGENILFMIPIIIVYQLAKLNKNFKTAYFKCFKKKRIENYDDDNNLDKDSANEDLPNNVSYDRGTEVIHF